MRNFNLSSKLFITTKDVCRLTGFSLRKAQMILFGLRDSQKKEKHQLITVKDFATYMGADVKDVLEALR